jgi:hypothetical protein
MKFCDPTRFTIMNGTIIAIGEIFLTRRAVDFRFCGFGADSAGALFGASFCGAVSFISITSSLLISVCQRSVFV